PAKPLGGLTPGHRTRGAGSIAERGSEPAPLGARVSDCFRKPALALLGEPEVVHASICCRDDAADQAGALRAADELRGAAERELSRPRELRRVFLPSTQAAPDYVDGHSNIVVR